jgi:hypothetical protein
LIRGSRIVEAGDTQSFADDGIAAHLLRGELQLGPLSGICQDFIKSSRARVPLPVWFSPGVTDE